MQLYGSLPGNKVRLVILVITVIDQFLSHIVLFSPGPKLRMLVNVVIYLYLSSRPLDGIVELFPTLSWSFSVVYPFLQSENQIAIQSLIAVPDHRCRSDLPVLGGNVSLQFFYTVLCSSYLTEHLSVFVYWLSSANFTSNNPRATTSVEDIETFDPSRPPLSMSDSILLLLGNLRVT